MITAKDIMSSNVVSVTPRLSVKELADLFLKHEVNGFPVVDDAGKVIGVVTEKDLIEQNKNLHIPTVVSLFDAVIYVESEKKFEEELKKFTGTCVDDIFTREAVTVSPDSPVSEVAALMADKNIHTLPVVDGENLAGVIGKLDVIRGLSRK